MDITLQIESEEEASAVEYALTELLERAYRLDDNKKSGLGRFSALDFYSLETLQAAENMTRRRSIELGFTEGVNEGLRYTL